MNIENKRQAAIILLAVGLGLGASVIMSNVVNSKIDEQTKIIAKEYQGRTTALVKEIDATKKELNKLSKDYAALATKVSQQKNVVMAPAPAPKPQVQKQAFSLRTPPGKRAITMEIDSLSAVGGLVNPGDFVDIIAKLEAPEEDAGGKKAKVKKDDKDKIITVLFQNIQVLAVGTNYDPVGVLPPYEAQKASKKLNITFAVNPEEASLLTFAQEKGKLQLSLRSPAETQDRLLQQVASWSALADFVLERQGTELSLPEAVEEEREEDIEIDKDRPFIQIFRGGREL